MLLGINGTIMTTVNTKHYTINNWNTLGGQLEHLEVINSKIQEEYELGFTTLSDLNNKFFLRTLTITLKLSELAKQQWLESVTIAQQQVLLAPLPIPPPDPALNPARWMMQNWLGGNED
jgi:hypothetical protein